MNLLFVNIWTVPLFKFDKCPVMLFTYLIDLFT